jgi:hypothetical protein
MRKLLFAVLLFLLATGLWAQSPPATEDAAQLRQEIDQLKKTINSLEKRLDAQEKATQSAAAQPAEAKSDVISAAELQTSVRDLGDRVSATERKSLQDHLQWGGDYRFEAHTIRGTVPSHYDGMQLQNLLVRTMFYMQTNGGMPPADVASIQSNVQAHYSDYQYFTNNLKFSDLQAAMKQLPPAMQQQLMGMLMPATYVRGYTADTNALLTNRLRLRFESKVADNVSFGARLSMYKVFGDSTGVQVFNGQPNSLNIDGTTARVPTGDMIRVERAFFNWNNIGGSKLYFSIGRRPSTDGPPLNFRQDELRGGTPGGTLFDYQYDGMTVGYHVTPKMTLRGCYGMGYTSGFGNGNLLKTAADRLKDVHLAGAVLDLYESDNTFVQALLAHAWNVTDGFNGDVVLPVNPVTGDSVPAPVVMRFTPSANLGGINLYGVTVQRSFSHFDFYGSANWVSLRPNGQTTPFGGLMSDPFEAPVNREGQMVMAGLRFKVPQNDGRTKIGFEVNHGTKYWFNFSQAEDDIIGPKTATRGEVYETYLTHRISDHFFFKADFMRYNYAWSGSGWHLGTPKRLDKSALLGFPTYDKATMVTVGLTAEF